MSLEQSPDEKIANGEETADYLHGWRSGWEAAWKAALEYKSPLKETADNNKTGQQVTGPRPQVPGPPVGPERREGEKKDWSDVRCTLCKQFHRAARYNCPKIPDIVAGKIQLPSDVCPLCLSLCDSSGRCTNTRRPCHELWGRGGSVSLVCKLHQPKTHFQICRSCPPDVPRTLGKQRTQLCFGPARSTRESIPFVPAKSPPPKIRNNFPPRSSSLDKISPRMPQVPLTQEKEGTGPE